MLDFYGLREQPFTLLPNPRFMHLSQPYQQTKAKLPNLLKDRTAYPFPASSPSNDTSSYPR